MAMFVKLGPGAYHSDLPPSDLASYILFPTIDINGDERFGVTTFYDSDCSGTSYILVSSDTPSNMMSAVSLDYRRINGLSSILVPPNVEFKVLAMGLEVSGHTNETGQPKCYNLDGYD